MAFVSSSLNPFCLKSFHLKPSQCQLGPKSSFFRMSSILNMPKNALRAKLMFQIRAVYDELMVGEEGRGNVVVSVAEMESTEPTIVVEEQVFEPSEIDKLKKQLVVALYGTDGGSKASEETKAAITEIIADLECNNPTPVINEGLQLLNGMWTLAYSSLAKGPLPLVKIGKVCELYDTENFAIQQTTEFVSLLFTTLVFNQATFQVQSSKRLQIEYKQRILGAPQVTKWSVPLENVELFGNKIDLMPIKSIPSYVQYVTSTITSRMPSLKIPILKKELWLVVTYLDEDLRIERRDEGLVAVFIKEGSLLLTA